MDQLNTREQSRFFGFDSFEGLPEDWGDVPRGMFAVEGRAPHIDDARVQFVQGLFQETLYGFLAYYVRAPRLA